MSGLSKYQTKPGIIRLFRIGDFYEAFDDDARTIGRELQITVTSTRGDNPRPLAGVPYHAVDRYVETLRNKGCQVEVIASDGKHDDADDDYASAPHPSAHYQHD